MGEYSVLCDKMWLPSLQQPSMLHSSPGFSNDIQNTDYGTNTAVFILALVAVYLVAVVWLVRRQIYQVQHDEEYDEDRVVMTDCTGDTKVKLLEKVLSDKDEVLM